MLTDNLDSDRSSQISLKEIYNICRGNSSQSFKVFVLNRLNKALEAALQQAQLEIAFLKGKLKSTSNSTANTETKKVYSKNQFEAVVDTLSRQIENKDKQILELVSSKKKQRNLSSCVKARTNQSIVMTTKRKRFSTKKSRVELSPWQ